MGRLMKGISISSGSFPPNMCSKTSSTLQPENITYINICFRNRFPEKLHFSYINIVSGIHIPHITLHVFVCDSENYMERLFEFIFLENRISVTQKNVCGINFAIVSDWSVR